MKNIDKIKSMDIDEMAEYMSLFSRDLDNYCVVCKIEKFCNKQIKKDIHIKCNEVWKLWLQQEDK